MHHACPFCDLRFDVVGNLETFYEDTAFISDNLGLKAKQGEGSIKEDD